MSRPGIEAVGVVVPARDEEDRLDRCLDALAGALERVPARVRRHVVVVLDGCTDRTGEVAARRPGVVALSLPPSGVGAARAAGAHEVVRREPGLDPGRLWLLSTDADSRVPPDWVTGQLALAAAGADAVVGTVVVEDWTGHPARTARRHERGYRRVDGHPHVHGANLGVRGAAYLAAGGFPPCRVGEDRALVRALLHGPAGVRVVASAARPVVTSARRTGRAAGGFADTLRSLALD